MTASEADIIETKDLGCHAGAEQLAAAASASGKTELLAQFAEDYPKGPHDQPQSMCPAFGSLVWACECAAQRRYSQVQPAVSTV